ncbi:MAG: HAMP domain-containing histidine kinase [Lactobacillales bacterium]|jgi:signal transduction histidine kinase|nr:HAMP domain-containing histidine kinase [Lactobacillales bacterium]
MIQKILRNPLTRLACGVIFFLTAYAVINPARASAPASGSGTVYEINSGSMTSGVFNSVHPSWQGITLPIFGNTYTFQPTTIYILIGFVAFCAFGCLYWYNAKNLMGNWFTRLNYTGICVVSGASCFALLEFIGHANNRPDWFIFTILAAMCTFVLLWFGTSIVRLRARSIRELAIMEEAEIQAIEERIKAERFKTELIANVSHDIRTPLTSIINYVDLIDRLSIENEELDSYVEVLKRTSNRLKSLIGDLLEASKAGTGNVKINIQKIDLAELLGQIAGDFDSLFNEKGLEYVDNIDHAFVASDGEQLYRVLENLLGNVIKYAKPDTRVFVDVIAENEIAKIKIRNTSNVIPEVTGEQLTEQFVQGDRSRKVEGNGLGLYIAKYLLENMNGTLTIEIDGDQFIATVTLPLN